MNTANIFSRALLTVRKTWTFQIFTFFAVTLAILFFCFFLLVSYSVQQAGEKFSKELRYVVFFTETPHPSLLEQVKQKILAFDQPRSIVYVSPAQAVKRFATQLGDERTILEGLPMDFLPPSLEITPSYSLRDTKTIRALADYLKSVPGVASVRYGQKWLAKLNALARIAKFTLVASGILVIIITTSVVATTIRLAVLSRSEEMRILQLLGASKSYIRAPFLVISFFQGFFGAGVALLLLTLLRLFIIIQAQATIPEPSLPPQAITLVIVCIIPLAAALLCAGGSYVSMQRHLSP